MALVQLNDICFEVKDRTLFTIKHLDIQHKDRIGLVGANGSGKTSLLRIIAKEEQQFHGSAVLHGKPALLPQLKPQSQHKSGGEVSKMLIDQIFAGAQDLLLMDEPTTYLDAEITEKIEQELQKRSEAMVITSHDRAFLDTLCTKIWEIDEGKVRVYNGNYSDYEQQKKEAEERHAKEYEKYVQEKAQLEEAVQLKEQKAQKATKKPKNLSSSEARITGAKPHFAKKQKKLNQGALAMQSRLKHLNKVEKPKAVAPVKMQVAKEEKLRNRVIIRGQQVEGKIGERILWSKVNFSITSGDKIGITGANGSGKTTFLLKILNQKEGITFSPAVTFGYFSQMLEVLNTKDSVMENMKASSVQNETIMRTVLARLGFIGEEVFKPVHVLSGGERVKAALAKLFVSSANVLVLDEPTNFLDITAVKALEALLIDYSGTVLFITHDRRLLANAATKLFILKEQQLIPFEGPLSAHEETPGPQKHEHLEDELLQVETSIAEVLSRLSIKPAPELDEEFQSLLTRKKALINQIEEN